MIETILERLFQEMKSAKVTKEKEDLFLLDVGEDLFISLHVVKNLLFLSANIASCPEENQEELFIYLMRANLLGEGTGKAVIGLDKEQNNIILNKAFAFEGNEELLKEEIELFANYLLYWKEEIEKFQAQKEANVLR